MNLLHTSLYAFRLAAVTLLVTTAPAWAQVSLGSASDFAVLGGTNVTCTAGVVTGDIGVAPGSAVPYTNTGCTVAGATPPATDAAAVQARVDFLSAYASVQYLPCTLIPGDLSGQNLAPGVYCTDAVAKAGTLTLTGPASGVWIFLVNGALTGTNFSVAMAGGGQPCNVYWAPTGSATLTDSALKGNILAGDATIGSITLTRGTLAGRAMSNVALTMTGASIIGCGALTEPGTPACRDKDHHGHHGDKDHKGCDRDGGKHDRDCDRPRSGHNNPFKPNDRDDKSDGRGGRR